MHRWLPSGGCGLVVEDAELGSRGIESLSTCSAALAAPLLVETAPRAGHPCHPPRRRRALARHGDERGCRYVPQRTEAIYEHDAERLREAGVEPDEIGAWRQEQIAAAQIRNIEDNYIGTVDDVVLHPETGEISYVIVAHGGFLVVGKDYAPVQAIEEAPQVTAEQLTGRDSFGKPSAEIMRHWEAYGQGRAAARLPEPGSGEQGGGQVVPSSACALPASPPATLRWALSRRFWKKANRAGTSRMPTRV
ncbi:MAG: PRC-barrel domain-containing protein, partial [Pseudomonadota bacterium]